MRPISRVRQKMEVPPAMDDRQHWHECTLEQDSITNANVTVLATRRDTFTVIKALERMTVNRATHPEINGTDIIKRPAVMTPKEITTPPPPQHRTQRGERALQQLESTCRVCMLQLRSTLLPPPHDCTKRKKYTPQSFESRWQSRHRTPLATALNYTLCHRT